MNSQPSSSGYPHTRVDKETGMKVTGMCVYVLVDIIHLCLYSDLGINITPFFLSFFFWLMQKMVGKLEVWTPLLVIRSCTSQLVRSGIMSKFS